MHAAGFRRHSMPVVLLCVAFAAFAALGNSEAWAAQSRCPSQSAARPPGQSTERVTLTRDEPIHFDFDGKRETSDRTEVVQARPALSQNSPIIAEVEGDLERTDRGDSFPVEAVSVVPRVMASGDLQLSVCLDSSIEHVEPGRYVGAIQLRGSEIQGTAIPLEATVAAQPFIAVICIFAGLIVGLLLKALADLEKEEQAKVNWPSLKKYVLRPAFVTAVVLGMLGAAISYFAVYATDDTWGTTSLDYVKLVAVGVFGQVTGMTAVDVVSPFKA